MDNAVVRNSLLEMEKYLFEIKRFGEGVLGSDSYYLNYLNDEIVVGILADKNIIDAVSKYDGRVAQKVASELVHASYYLRDKNAVVEIARTVSKYDGRVAQKVASELVHASYYLRDKNAVVEIARTVSKYEGDVAWVVARWLANAACNSRYKNAVVEIADILASEEVVNSVKKYDGDATKEVAYWLAHAAYYLIDKDAVVEIARTVSKYEGDVAWEVAYWLAHAAYYLIDKDAVVEIARTVSKYEGDVAWEVAYWLAYAAYYLRDKDAVVEIARTVSKYEGDVAWEVACWLAYAAYYLRDKDAVVEIAGTVSKYDDAAWEVACWLARAGRDWGDKNAVVEIADILASEEVVNSVKKYDGDATKEVAYWLAHAAYHLRDKNAVVEIADILASEEVVNSVKKYDGDAATEVACWLAYAAYHLRDGKRVRKIVKMLEKVGKSIFDTLENHEIYEIIDENLDRLVSDKSSFNAVAVYIKSKKRLTKPDESNIKDYNTLALEYVKRKYGLNKDISIHQILMLFAAPEIIIKEVIDLVNNSKERNVKYYSLETKDGKILNYSREELMMYAIISIVGSRDKERERQAIDAIASIVGRRVVDRARSEFNSNYKHLMRDIVAAFRDRDYSKALDILKQTENEAIMDVINAVDYRDIDIGSARFIKAVESNNPLDYDSRIQMACVYLPSGARRGEILKYCRNDNFVLVRYDVGNQTLGSAICYMEDGIFLVDSVEGHRRFRKPEIFEIVYNDLINRAREKKAKMIVFNIDVFSETPLEFIEYLSGKNLPKKRIKMSLDTDGYLEAKKDGVKGYVVKF